MSAYRHSCLAGMVIALLMLAAGRVGAVEPEPFGRSQTIIFVGDSITAQGHYLRFLTELYALRYPGADSPLIRNQAIGGQNTQDAMLRLERDILPLGPSLVVIAMGMNDVGRQLYTKPDPDASTLNSREGRLKLVAGFRQQLIDKLKAAGVPFMFVSPSPTDDDLATGTRPALHGANDGLALLTRQIGDDAAKAGVAFIDLHTPMWALDKQLKAVDPKRSVIGPDRVHPQWFGGIIMASYLAKAQGVIPFEPTLEIEVGDAVAPEGKVDRDARNGLTIEWKPPSLPLILDRDVKEAAQLIPELATLARQTLIVRGLPEGSYEIFVVGYPAAPVTAAQLRSGFDIAALKGNPSIAQSAQVRELNTERSRFEVLLRDKAFFDGYYPKHGIDPKDEAAVAEYSQKQMARSPNSDTWTRTDDYIRTQRDPQSVQRKIESLEKQIRDVSEPQVVKLQIKARGR